jgi:hypothetical protein
MVSNDYRNCNNIIPVLNYDAPESSITRAIQIYFENIMRKNQHMRAFYEMMKKNGLNGDDQETQKWILLNDYKNLIRKFAE